VYSIGCKETNYELEREVRRRTGSSKVESPSCRMNSDYVRKTWREQVVVRARENRHCTQERGGAKAARPGAS